MEPAINSFLEEKLDLFESHLNHAWVKCKDNCVTVLSKSMGLPFFEVGHTYELNDIIHKLDQTRVLDHYGSVTKVVHKIQFTVYQKGEDNLKIVCSSKQHDEGSVLSLWILLPDETKSLGLLAMAAHDMRSPISSIVGLINLMQMMMMDGQIPAEELSNMMDMIKTSSSKALQLTDEILELADMESEGYVLTTKPVILREYVADYIKKHASFKLKKRIDVILHAKTDGMSEINEARLTRVLDNLISNAAKFSYPDSTIDIIVEDVEDEIVVRVQDHGVGMPKEMIDEIFVKFGKAQRPGLEGEDSHGLGMSIVKQIMTLHGGYITVESEERKGTTMNLFFKRV